MGLHRPTHPSIEHPAVRGQLRVVGDTPVPPEEQALIDEALADQLAAACGLPFALRATGVVLFYGACALGGFLLARWLRLGAVS